MAYNRRRGYNHIVIPYNPNALFVLCPPTYNPINENLNQVIDLSTNSSNTNVNHMSEESNTSNATSDDSNSNDNSHPATPPSASGNIYAPRIVNMNGRRYFMSNLSMRQIYRERSIPRPEFILRQAFYGPSDNDNYLYNCPLLSDCSWKGRKRYLRTHIQDLHTDRIFNIGESFQRPQMFFGKYLVVDSNRNTYVLVVSKYGTNNNLFYDINYLEKNQLVHLTFEMQQRKQNEIIRQDKGLLEWYTGRISVKGSITNADNFIIKIRQYPALNITCVKCTTLLKFCFAMATPMWYCNTCKRFVRTCFNWFEGCGFLDNESKCIAHEQYFCHYGKWCFICPMQIEEKSLISHYQTQHSDAIFTNDIVFNDYDRCTISLISCQQHYLVVECSLERNPNIDDYLILHVYMPYISPKVKKYNLFVRIKDVNLISKSFPACPFEGNDRGADWYMKINIRDEFPTWPGRLFISFSTKTKCLTM